jgi:hypothetical protein
MKLTFYIHFYSPLKEKSPNQKNGIQKYLSHKVYSDT